MFLTIMSVMCLTYWGVRSGNGHLKTQKGSAHPLPYCSWSSPRGHSTLPSVGLNRYENDFPRGPVVKNQSSNAGGHRFNLWSRKIPHATEQLNLGTTATESIHPRARVPPQEASATRSPKLDSRPCLQQVKSMHSSEDPVQPKRNK